MGYIMLAIVLSIILLLLVAPIKILIKYDGDFDAVLKYLFLKVGLVEKQDEETEKEKEEKEEKKEEEEVEKEKSKLELSTIEAGYNALKGVISRLSTKALRIVKRIKIKNLYIDIKVSEDDPYSTGVVYGQTVSGVYGIYALLIKCFTVKEKETAIIINPDFEKNSWKYKIEAELSIRPITLIRYGLSILIELVKALIIFNKEMKKQD